MAITPFQLGFIKRGRQLGYSDEQISKIAALFAGMPEIISPKVESVQVKSPDISTPSIGFSNVSIPSVSASTSAKMGTKAKFTPPGHMGSFSYRPPSLAAGPSPATEPLATMKATPNSYPFGGGIDPTQMV